MKKQGNKVPSQEQNKYPGAAPLEAEISELPRNST